MMKQMVLALLMLTCVSVAWSQEFIPAGDPRLRRVEVSGAEVHSVMIAWEALKAQYEQDSSLSEFEVTYVRVEGRPATIWFFKPNTIIRHPDGSTTIRMDNRSYPVVVDGDEVRVLPEGTSLIH